MKPFNSYFFMLEDGVEYQAINESGVNVRVIAKVVGRIATDEGAKNVWEELPIDQQFLINMINLKRINDARTTQ